MTRPTATRPLTGQELEDALRRFFDAERLPEIAVVPTELLAEIARRERKREEEVGQQSTGP